MTCGISSLVQIEKFFPLPVFRCFLIKNAAKEQSFLFYSESEQKVCPI